VLEFAPRQLTGTFEAACLILELNPQTLVDLATFRPHLKGQYGLEIRTRSDRTGSTLRWWAGQIAQVPPPVIEPF